MIEPTYEYQKGVGWVPLTGTVVQLAETIVIQYRVPQVGERYTYFSADDSYYVNDDNTIKISTFTLDFKSYRHNNFSLFEQDDYNYYRGRGYFDENDRSDGRRIWIVIKGLDSNE